MITELQEIQRPGRNKDTTINHAYIDSSSYRRKFDNISDNKKLNRIIYQFAKNMYISLHIQKEHKKAYQSITIY